MTNQWQQLTIHASQELTETISDWLFEHDAISVTFAAADENEIFEPKPDTTPLWHATKIVALFNSNIDLETILIQLTTTFNQHIKLEPITIIHEQNWQQQWQQSVQPMIFGDKLMIYPSHALMTNTHLIGIELDPGLAFGTGTHESTALCLDWLATNDISQKTVIDYGCGSGILAIAAVKLGAKKVYAIDYDPQAITASKENATKNQITEQELVIEASSIAKPPACDIVVANILANTIIELKNRLTDCVLPSGQLILAGILNEQAKQVMNAFQHDFEFEAPIVRNQWVLLSAKKHNQLPYPAN